MIPDGTNRYRRWPVASPPGTMWIEGKSSAGFLSGESGLRLWYSTTNPPNQYGSYPGAGYNPDLVSVTIVAVDMDMLGLVDAEEESVGGYIPLGGVKKIDLWRVQPEGFAYPPGTPPSGVPVDSAHPLTLDVEYSGRGSGLIEIWDSAEMTGSPLSLPITYTDALTLPDDVWVKGTSLSSSLKRITLVAQYSIGGRTVQDRIKCTVYGIEQVYPDGDTKVMISTRPEDPDPYHSSYQEEDGKIKVVAQIRPVIEGMEVYFRPQDPDPEDGSPYDDDTPPGDDNIGGVGSVNPTSAVTNSLGRADTILTITNRYAGDNYRVEASVTSDFEAYIPSGLLVAWKRIYAEVDMMYVTGSYLKSDFTHDGDSDPDWISIWDVERFATGDTVHIFDADNEEWRQVIEHDYNLSKIKVGDLNYSYKAGYTPNEGRGAAVGKSLDGGFIIDQSRLDDAYGSVANGSDGGCFVEIKELPDGGGNIPYNLIGDGIGSVFNPELRHVWFKNKDKSNYVWMVGMAHDVRPYDEIYGVAGDHYAFVYIGEIKLRWTDPGEAIIAGADTLAHELGHIFELANVDLEHEYVLCHTESDRCVMDYGRDMIDDCTEFCYDGTNHLMAVRSAPDGL